jgi:hypothetical protein
LWLLFESHLTSWGALTMRRGVKISDWRDAKS